MAGNVRITQMGHDPGRSAGNGCDVATMGNLTVAAAYGNMGGWGFRRAMNSPALVWGEASAAAFNFALST